MKLTNLLLLLALLMFSNCKEEESHPISLFYQVYNNGKPIPVTDNKVSLQYPTSENIQLLILGGDGDFFISNSNETILNIRINGRLIDLTPSAIGTATLTIYDRSNNSYIFNVSISYTKYQFSIDKQDVVVIGEKLSAEQKKQIELEAMATLPVKLNGRYRFIHNNENRNKGKVFIYKNGLNDKAIEGNFEIKDYQEEGYNYRSYIISIDGEQRKFILNKYLTLTKKEMVVPMALFEILTKKFKTEYPNIELVYTQQRIKN